MRPQRWNHKRRRVTKRITTTAKCQRLEFLQGSEGTREGERAIKSVPLWHRGVMRQSSWSLPARRPGRPAGFLNLLIGQPDRLVPCSPVGSESDQRGTPPKMKVGWYWQWQPPPPRPRAAPDSAVARYQDSGCATAAAAATYTLMRIRAPVGRPPAGSTGGLTA